LKAIYYFQRIAVYSSNFGTTLLLLVNVLRATFVFSIDT
jgi:hypothetical protein